MTTKPPPSHLDECYDCRNWSMTMWGHFKRAIVQLDDESHAEWLVAQQFLLESLSETQRDDYRVHHAFSVTNTTGLHYIIACATSANVVAAYPFPGPHKELCAVWYHVDPYGSNAVSLIPDLMLTEKLLLESAESFFLTFARVLR